MPTISIEQAHQRGIGKNSLLACAKWNRDAAKKARNPKDRQRLSEQAVALETVAGAL